MKWTTKTETWVSILLFVALSLAVFYISFFVEQNSLYVSLLGVFFVLFMGLLAITLDFRMKSKKYSLLTKIIGTLVLVNVFVYVIQVIVLSQNLAYFFAFSITYTIMYILFAFIRNKLN